ncbi:hypothetical protein [Streptomyces sp. NBC_00557]|uniref:hypothetical protein n=1 Tax=Streptomyces sp. NBC_00557 TaxID=2975776 RepID=UPI002E808327|nr:hypothetical protein [Streptomyces sp. NBC_00557]WUC36359.1 hypothetical protein OG956_20120 [Streptomyces sp. NBC_00557]
MSRYRPRQDVADLLRQGASYRQVQDEIGCCPGVIAATRKAYRIPITSNGRRRTPEERAALEQQVLTLLLQGASYRTIREQTGASQPTIVAIRRQSGLPTPGQDYVAPSRTVDEVLALYSELGVPGGHVLWRGPVHGRCLQLCAEGHRYNARRVVFERHHGRPPRGYVTPTCGEARCIAGPHLADAALRHARVRKPS